MTRRLRPQVDPDVPYLPALLLLFVGSGCAALIYQIVWLQLLELVIGSSAVSLGVLLGTFMGGMCLGSFALPRTVRSAAHPLKVYAYLELGIGIAGLLLLYGMPLRKPGLCRDRWRRRCSCGRRRAVPAAADHDDGCDAPCRGPMGRSHARRRVVAGILLRRQHRRRRGRHAARGLLSAPRLRHGGRDVGRGGDERGGRHRRAGSRLANAVLARCRRGAVSPRNPSARPRRARSTSPSRCRD